MKLVPEKQPVFWQLMQLAFQYKHRVSEISEGYDLTIMQSGALIMLKDDEPKPMRVLSNYFMCDASVITGLADRLEKRGLIERSAHPSDRRITLISLTEEGARLKAEIIAKTDEAEAERLNESLSEAERQILQELLQRVLTIEAPNTDKDGK